ncbi:MAG: hypothetical protein PHH83_04700 [Patescibacteria group bacterium]|nr:hypothetical protein [Patescibacteria group bacterium]
MDKFKKLFIGIKAFFCVFFYNIFSLDKESVENTKPICSKCGKAKEELPSIATFNSEIDLCGFNTNTRYYSCRYCNPDNTRKKI